MSDSIAPGTLLAGKYRVIRVLGQGGMGTVLLARHEELEQNVAIKVLVGSLVHNTDIVARFSREARLAAKLQSDHVVRVTDVGKVDSFGPYMVMEYLQGTDLATLVHERGSLPPVEAVDYVLEAIDAIAEAHALGIVHRDLKPANLFLATKADGSRIVKVLDFGISKMNPLGETSTQITSTTDVMGSPAYMSPEQLRSAKDVDGRADIWSLGVVLYELIAGALPFDGVTTGALFTQIVSKDPASLCARRPGVPPFLEAVIFRCLRREAHERHATVAALAQALAPFGSGRAQRQVSRAMSLLRRSDVAFEDTASFDTGEHGSRPPPFHSAAPPYPASVPPAPQSAKTLPLASSPTIATQGAWDMQRSTSTRRVSDRTVVAAIVLVAVAGLAIAMTLRVRDRAPPPSSALPMNPVIGALPPPPALTAPPPLPALTAVPIATTAQPARVLDAGVTPPRAKTPARVVPAVSCDPPWFVDGEGNRVFKKECI